MKSKEKPPPTDRKRTKSYVTGCVDGFDAAIRSIVSFVKTAINR